MTNCAHFDEYAKTYDEALAQALSISGEDKDYFAEGRLNWLADCLRELNTAPTSTMDYGCGPGSTAALMPRILGTKTVVGIDISSKCLEVARRAQLSDQICFLLRDQYEPNEQMDLVYCNGVFHHIPPTDRVGALDYVYRSLRPGGLLSFWENNPWNPGTKYVMAHCPFDDDAITLSAPEAVRLLRSIRFEVLRTDFLFIFPKVLSRLRRIERFLSRLPLGAQYQALCRKLSRGEQRGSGP